MLRILKITLIVLLLSSISVLSLSCALGQDSAPASENEVVTVQRGDLTVDITAVGNLALSQTEDLAFAMAGTVEEVLVNTGDSVVEGQELVKLDTSKWQDQMTTLKRKLVTAQRALTTAERLIGARELAVQQAELDLQTAEYNVGQIAEVKEVQDTIDNAEYALKFAKSMLAGHFGEGVQLIDYTYWSQLKALAEAELAKDREDLQAILDGSSIHLSTDVVIQVAKYQLQVEQSQKQLEDAQIAVGNARIDKENAEQDLKDAQEELDEAKSLSPIITAPFDGFITRVNVEGGDEVLKGTVAVQFADPNKFEAEIMVSEIDILQVRLGGTAWVQVDSIQGLSLPAEVTHISPTATIQSGVVNYRVKVEIQSLEAVTQERQQARQEMMGDISSGEIPDRLKQAIEEGLITQEQAEEMMKRIQSGEMPSPPTGEGGQIPFTTGGGQMQVMVPENFQLREGLTVTVSIIVESKTGVLLVPNAAITTQGGRTYVQVLSPDGTTEERVIQTGISNWQYTEVTDGLTEGEQIIVPQGTTITPTTPQPGGRMQFFPGGGIHR